ncbi:peptidase S33, proline iminopeptidase 1 [Thiobacillus denitrificans ATCC 25259]|uniref:Proline iminopeptidase n=1 Tax=Thiobacillus denitrificans (strain ATCC 25259 / T1) TaxID=292415 RepID=Q3SEZ3_THIDA|nr:prolyl aminopeptidase [Thiobacillus denitrificans]AAZ96840.1 peptidase S33, proline iminopeptidase 1 [Thiobacillus denitrificans ATCC 25259]
MSGPASLYPPITPYASGLLETDGVHRIYWETSGNPAGIPVLFVHGGPGAGTSANQRRFFDPARYRIVLFDQRGCGRSTPHGELADNTTPHLIADMEALRDELDVASWLVFGGSWGSTLALAYAQAHPERCRGLVLRGIFLCRPQEIDWFLYGIRSFFPEAQRQLAEFIPEDERDDLLVAYHRRLVDPDPAVHRPAAWQWATFEASCSTLLPSAELVAAFGSERTALSLSRIEAHYFVNGIFLPDDSLLANVARIRHIPALIVQGRYDAVCPITSADDLARAWPEAHYQVVPDAGHSAFEPGIARALVAACDRFAATGALI